MEVETTLEVQLKNKRICRFCLCQDDALSNIYSTENRLKSRAPLPLQIMACVSIEVFTNDEMPSTICESCRMIMDYSYRFKQMCKRADTALKQFPLTGQWPIKLDLPQFPDILLKKQLSLPVRPIKREINNEDKVSPSVKRVRLDNLPISSMMPPQNLSPTMQKLNKFIGITQSQNKRSPPKSQSSPVVRLDPPQFQPSSDTPQIRNIYVPRQKLLNTNPPVKILNKNAPTTATESKMQIDMEIQILNDSRVEMYNDMTEFNKPNFDRTRNAAPVATNVFPCDKCDRSFPLRQLLDIHMHNHTRTRSFQCAVCSKRFFSKYDLGKHSLIHSGDKPHVCVVCKKAFSRATLLYRHERIHTDQPKFLCVYCEKPFLSMGELNKHTERHKKYRPFPCSFCGKRFAFKQGLERHEIVHSTEQPYKCEHCATSFSTSSKLARHLTAHAGRRPYPCRLCPKSYLMSHHLTRHLRSHKDIEGSFRCFDCAKVFASRDELIYHSALHATQNLVCPLCKEQFDNLDNVTEHIKSHTENEQFACEFCDLIFITEQKLEMHSKSEHADDHAAYVTDNQTRIIKKESFTPDSSWNESDEMCGADEVIEEFIIDEINEEPSPATTFKMKQEPKILNFNTKRAVDLDPQIEITTMSVKDIKGEAICESENENNDTVVFGISETDSSGKIVGNVELVQHKPKVIRKMTYSKPTISEPLNKPLNVTIVNINDSSSNVAVTKVPPKTINSTAPIDEEVTTQAGVKLFAKKLSQLQKQKLQQTEKKSPPKTLPTSQSVAKLPTVGSSKVTPTDKVVDGAIALTTKKNKQVLENNLISPTNTAKHANLASDITTSDTATAETSGATKSNIATSSTSTSNMVTLPKSNLTQMNSLQNNIPSPKVIYTKSTNVTKSGKQVMQVKIGDEVVKVQKVKMTKSQVAAMAKEGKIEMKDGQVFLKQKKQ